MSQQANVTAYDGASTPVAHVFETAGVTKDPSGAVVAEWEERLTGVPIGFNVRFQLRKRKLKNGKTQCSLAVQVPVQESVAGPNLAGYTATPAVAFEDQFVISQYNSPRSTLVNRKLCAQLALNLFGGIATSVAPVTTGPVADLFHKEFMPT